MKQFSDPEIQCGEGKNYFTFLIKTILDSSDNDSILLTKNLQMKKKKMSQTSNYLKTNTNLISAFFILYLMIFCVITLRYIPNFYTSAKSADLYLSKMSIKYFSDYFPQQGLTQVKFSFNSAAIDVF